MSKELTILDKIMNVANLCTDEDSRRNIIAEQLKELTTEAFSVGFDKGFYRCKSNHALRSNFKPDKFIVDIEAKNYSHNTIKS